MLKNHPIKSYLVYSVPAALLYSVLAYLFIRNQTFNSLWILYIGNALFGCCIALFVILYNKRRKENASTETMMVAGNITTIMGVIIACIISVLLFLLMSDVSHPLQQTEVLNNAPPQMESGKRNQFLLSLFMNAIIGNVSVGAFISLIISYAAKRDQKGGTSTKTTDEPEVLNENKA
ncbi:MAG: hypothetical protein ABJA71_06740 [Ginsengibacter sp.]